MKNEPGTLAHHLEQLVADAEDVKAMLTAQHDEGGDIRPEALPKAERLHTSLRDVLHELTHNEHLAMTSDDVWAALTQKHSETEIHPDN